MAKLTETATYVEDIPRLDLDTPVKGYDGKEIGPANEQAQALANRTAYLKKHLVDLEETVKDIDDKPYVSTINQQSGDVTLTYLDVEADASGAADEAVKDHVAEENPHTQYITKENAENTLVAREEANVPNGYLQLDKEGEIPTEFGDPFKARYIIVGNIEERLAITAGGNITICLQTDVNTVYYLNAGDDPTVDSNWSKGSTPEQGNVVSVFGRSGIVIPEKGDYTTDLITETDDRTFVSDADREKWDNKQETLVSGTNVKTINDASILGSGDIEITPEAIGAAATEHKHTPEDIKTDENNRFVTDAEITAWNQKQNKLTSGESIATVFGKDILANTNIDIKDADNLIEVINSILKAGNGIDISIDETDGAIVIARSQEDIDKDKPTVIEIENVIGGRGYRFRLKGISFDSNFKVFKKIPIFEQRVLTIDYNNPDIPLVVNSLPDNDELGYYPNGKPDISVTLSAASFVIEKYTSDEITTSIIDPETMAVTVFCENTLENVLPIFTATGTKDNFTPFASSSYGDYLPWKAFQEQLGDKDKAPVADKNAWSAQETWENRPAETYLGIKNTSKVKVTGYGFQNFTSLYYSSWSTPPTAWDFQGRDEDTDDWVTLDSQTDQSIMNGQDGWTTYRLDKFYMFKQYRILIKNVVITGNARAVIPRFAICNDVGILVKDKDGRYLASDNHGDYTPVTVTNANDFRTYCFNTPLKPLSIELFEYISPVKICTLKNIPVTIRRCSVVPAIAIQNPIYPQTFWDGLQDINPSKYYSDNSDKEIRIAATIDGVNYYVYGDNGWTEVTKYTNDSASAEALIEEGMTGESFYDITPEQWGELLSYADEPIIGLAYARNIVAKDMPITPETVEISFNEVDGWEVMSFDKANIRFTDDFIIFNPVDDGDYKFSYLFK